MWSYLAPSVDFPIELRLFLLLNNHQINCAGIEGVRPLLDVDIDWAKQLYDVNVWGPLLVTQTFGPLVIKARGIIANFSSIGCKIPMCWAGKSLFKFSTYSQNRKSDILTTRHLLQLQGCHRPNVRHTTNRNGAVGRPCRDSYGWIRQHNDLRQA